MWLAALMLVQLRTASDQIEHARGQNDSMLSLPRVSLTDYSHNARMTHQYKCLGSLSVSCLPQELQAGCAAELQRGLLVV